MKYFRLLVCIVLLAFGANVQAAGPRGPSMNVYDGVDTGDYWHEITWDFHDLLAIPNGYWHNKFTYHHPVGPFIGEEVRGLYETFTVFDLADATEAAGLLSNNYSQFTLESLGVAPEAAATATRFVYQGTGVGGVDVANGFISLYDDIGSTVAPLSFTHYRARTPGVTIGGGTFYGLYIENQLGQYGVYQAGTTDSNVFFGKVGIGVVPTHPFDFVGTVSTGRILQYNGTSNANGGESVENHDYTINMAEGSSFFDDHGVVSYTLLVNVDQNYDFLSDSVYGVSISNSVQKSIANPIGVGGLKVNPAFNNNSASVLDTGIGVEVQWFQNAGNLKYATGLTVQPSVIAVGASISNFAGAMLGNDAGFGVVQSQDVPNLFTGNVRIGGAAFTWGVLAAPTPIRQLDVRGDAFFASPVQVGVTPTASPTSTAATASATPTPTATLTVTPTNSPTPTPTITIFIGATSTAATVTATPTSTSTPTPAPALTAAPIMLDVAGAAQFSGPVIGSIFPMFWGNAAAVPSTTVTNWIGSGIAGGWSNNEVAVQVPMPIGGQILRLVCSTSGAPGGGNYFLSMRRNNTDIPGVCRLTGTGNPARCFVDYAPGTFVYNSQDHLALQSIPGPAPASAAPKCGTLHQVLNR